MPSRVPRLGYRPTMPVVVRRAADRFGDADFVVMEDRRLSFRQAEAASRLLAKELLASGVGKGTRIGIHLPTGPEWAVAWIAATRVGALAMPFSTVYRPAELRTALRLGDVAVLLAPATMLGKDYVGYLEEVVPGLTRANSPRLWLPDLPYLRSIRLLGAARPAWARPFEVAASASSDNETEINDAFLAEVESEVTPADLLTAVFTSGTTATPKAVVHTHGAVIRKTAPVANAGLGTTFPGRVLSYMPFFWVGGLQNLMGALQSGAAVLTQERLEPVSALALAEREQATSFNGNATTLRSVMAGPGASGVALASLRPQPRRPWEGGPSSRGELPTPLGMTETVGVWAAIDGFSYRVAHPETREDVSEGEEGEFLVRGYSLMQGIYKREREEVFTPDGFYATGDRGYVEAGLVYFHGRLTDMIKSRGANVAPAEVEAVLNLLPGVQLALVVGLPHDEREQEVAAAIVARPGEAVDVDQLIEAAGKQLSPYKVPTFIEVVDRAEVVWMPTSKADKRAIAALLAARRAERNEGSPQPSAGSVGTNFGPR